MFSATALSHVREAGGERCGDRGLRWDSAERRIEKTTQRQSGARVDIPTQKPRALASFPRGDALIESRISYAKHPFYNRSTQRMVTRSGPREADVAREDPTRTGTASRRRPQGASRGLRVVVPRRRLRSRRLGQPCAPLRASASPASERWSRGTRNGPPAPATFLNPKTQSINHLPSRPVSWQLSLIYATKHKPPRGQTVRARHRRLHIAPWARSGHSTDFLKIAEVLPSVKTNWNETDLAPDGRSTVSGPPWLAVILSFRGSGGTFTSESGTSRSIP